MSFSVEPTALVSYARQLDRASADASAIASYIGTYAKDATGGELIAIAGEGHRHAVTVISDTLRRLTTLLDASGPELVAAATYYRQTDLTTAAGSLRQMWQGQAGEAAYSYFTQLANAAGSLRGPLSDIGHEYKVMAGSVWSINEALGGVIKGLVDAAIIAGIAAAAGTATSVTGVGAIVGYGVAAGEIAYMLKLWAQATQLYQHATAAVLAFRSALAHRLGDLESVALPALPDGSGYDHPLASAGAAR